MIVFWTRLAAALCCVVLALIFPDQWRSCSGVCLLLSLTAYYELVKACHGKRWQIYTAGNHGRLQVCCMAQR